ncbi:hypothetical protein [Companilactobacillus mishanensis]|uniref:hypothetical protein n=1 Tax=Companilactobacillus mishanensis TaxID=2486008 RepID=UPI0012959E4F|nr:hypothetical protein [Companilactobacillus mishanensis]
MSKRKKLVTVISVTILAILLVGFISFKSYTNIGVGGQDKTRQDKTRQDNR